MRAAEIFLPVQRIGHAHWSRRLCVGRPRFASGGATPATKKPLEKIPHDAQAKGSVDSNIAKGGVASNTKPAKPLILRIAPIAIPAVLGSAAAFYVWQKYRQRADEAKRLADVSKTPFVQKKSTKREESLSEPIPMFVQEEVTKATDEAVITPESAMTPEQEDVMQEVMLEMTNDAMSTMASTAAAETSGQRLANMAQSVITGTEKRNMVRKGLNEAFAVQDIGKIADVLAIARASFLGTNANMQPSEGINGSTGLTQNGVESNQSAPVEFEEAVIIEKTNSASLRLEKVKRRIIELTGYLATIRYTHLEAAEIAMLEESEGTLDHANNVRNMATEKELHELQIRLQQELDGAVTKLLQEEEWLQSEREYALTKERCARLVEVVSFNSGLSALEDLLSPAAMTVHNVHGYNNLSNAVSGFHHAILSGGNAHNELVALQSAASKTDPFINQLISQLPTGCAELCKGGVPTEPLICSHLAAQVKDLTAAAFVPPGSGLFGEIMGRFFGWLYIMDPTAFPLDSANSKGKGPSEVANNLRTLHSVSQHLQGGKVNASYVCLENSLTGTCRERATGWLTEARNTLLLLQTLGAIQARVQCLNAAIPNASTG